ncbi:alpha/beta fold hydrolase [Bacillus cereus group sp. BfR-BA-01522]|uniref:alpha/beta fold hydrolase n=1 Tax=Bacillus cereus group sp. BfR-BA-01522 TaxID=2920370 RepID=UPI001F5AEAEF|nr:alpha/beta hydrolase [Bacillus cereus group sp. BfR-BA-01522]
MINKLQYECVNEKHTERVVFLNPLGATSQVWDLYKKSLINDFEIILIDYPGFQNTEYHYVSSIQELTQLVTNTINELDEKPLHLIGYSFGGYVAQNLVMNSNLNVKTLTLIGSSKKVFNQGESLTSEWIKILNHMGLETFLKQLALWSFHTKTFEINPHTMRMFTISSIRGCSDKRVYENQLELITNYKTNMELEKIRVPSLIICGEYDNLYPKFCSEELKNSIKNARLIEVKDVGHAVPWEDPKKVLGEIYNFLRVNNK